jgi:hypothetical protein
MNNRVLTILLVAVLALLLLLYWVLGSDRSTLSATDVEFAVKDTAGITQITLTEYRGAKKGRQIELVRQLPLWKINEQFPAQAQKINLLLKTIHAMQVRKPVDPEGVKNVIKYIQSDHIRVDIQTQLSGTKTFFVGNEMPTSPGTMMLLEGSELPCVVELPGLEGYLKPIFYPQIEQWRDIVLLNVASKAIRRIEVQYKGADSSWVLLKQGTYWQLQSKEAVDTAAIARYLRQFQRIPGIVHFAPNVQQIFDSIRKQTPDIRFRVTDANDKLSQLNLYYKPEDVNNLFCWVEGQDELYRVQLYAIGALLVKRAYFFPQRPAQP